jgi:hypothetical protein
MGTFPNTAIVDYRLSFAAQRKQTSVYHFRFPSAPNKQKFAVSVFCLRQRNGNCRFR